MKKVISIISMMALVMLLFTACSSSNVAVTVGDQEVPVGEAIFVLRELEAMYEQQYGVEIWDQGYEGTTFDEIAKEGAMESITRLYISNDIAKENGIELSEEERANIDALMEQYLAVNTEELLSEDGITIDDVKAVFELNAIGEKLMDTELVGFELDEAELATSLANDPTFQQIEEFGYDGVLEQVTAQHVLVSTVKEDGTDITEEELAVAMATAEEVLAKAEVGVAFDGLVADYTEDPGWTENGGIYTFYRGEMVDAFENAAFSMEIGSIQLVESEYGYHVITKLDHVYPDEAQVESVKEYQDYLVEQYTLAQKQATYDALYSEWKLDYEVTENEKVWAEVLTSHQMNSEVVE